MRQTGRRRTGRGPVGSVAVPAGELRVIAGAAATSIRAGCAPTAPSPAGATTTGGSRMRPAGNTPPSPSAGAMRAGYAPTAPSPAGAATAGGSRMRPAGNTPPSPPATSIRAGCAPTAPSPAGAATAGGNWTRPAGNTPPSPPATSIRAGCAPTAPSPAGASTSPGRGTMGRRPRPPANTPPSPPGRSIRARCAPTAPSSAGAIGISTRLSGGRRRPRCCRADSSDPAAGRWAGSAPHRACRRSSPDTGPDSLVNHVADVPGMRVAGAQAGGDRPQPDELVVLVHEDDPGGAEYIYKAAARAAWLWPHLRGRGSGVAGRLPWRWTMSSRAARSDLERWTHVIFGSGSAGLEGPRRFCGGGSAGTLTGSDRTAVVAFVMPTMSARRNWPGADGHGCRSRGHVGRWLRPRVRLDGRPSDRLAVRYAAVPATVLVTAGGSSYRSRVRTLLDRAEPRRLHWTTCLRDPPGPALPAARRSGWH